MWNVTDIGILGMSVLVPYIVPEASHIHYGLGDITLDHIRNSDIGLGQRIPAKR